MSVSISYKKLLTTLIISMASYGFYLTAGAILVARLPTDTTYYTIVAKIHPIAAGAGIVLLVIAALLISGRKINHSLSFHRIKFKQGLLWLAIIALANLILLAAGKYFTNSAMVAWGDLFSLPLRDVLLFLLAVAIIQPLYEELLFRGFMFQGLQDAGLNNWSTVTLIALLWTLFHQPHDAVMWCLSVFMGVMLGLARLKTGSSFTSYLMHVIFILLQAINYGIVAH